MITNHCLPKNSEGVLILKKSFNSKFQYISVLMITLILNLLTNALILHLIKWMFIECYVFVKKLVWMQIKITLVGCELFIVWLQNISLKQRSHHCRWRPACKISVFVRHDEQWGTFIVPRLIRLGTSALHSLP